MSNKQIELQAFVLHARPFQENQQLVELLTEHEGKMSALVFVGQSKRSIKKGMIQPFLPLKITIKGSDADLKRITQIESAGNSLSLRKYSLYSGFYVNELLVRLLNDDIRCEALFSQYQLTLSALADGLPIAPQLRKFELCLLAELGVSFDFGPVFEQNNENVVGFYHLAEHGFMPAYTYSVKNITTKWFYTEHLQSIAAYVHHETPLTSKVVEHTFKLLMRDVIDHLLDGKPLNSRNLFTKNKREKHE